MKNPLQLVWGTKPTGGYFARTKTFRGDNACDGYSHALLASQPSGEALLFAEFAVPRDE